MIRVVGKERWAIAEGYVPETSHGPEPETTSHETLCILNANDEDARVEITVCHAADPTVPYEVTIPAERPRHVRFNDLADPEPVSTGTDSRARSSRPCRSCGARCVTKGRSRTHSLATQGPADFEAITSSPCGGYQFSGTDETFRVSGRQR